MGVRSTTNPFEGAILELIVKYGFGVDVVPESRELLEKVKHSLHRDVGPVHVAHDLFNHDFVFCIVQVLEEPPAYRIYHLILTFHVQIPILQQSG